MQVTSWAPLQPGEKPSEGRHSTQKTHRNKRRCCARWTSGGRQSWRVSAGVKHTRLAQFGPSLPGRYQQLWLPFKFFEICFVLFIIDWNCHIHLQYIENKHVKYFIWYDNFNIFLVFVCGKPNWFSNTIIRLFESIPSDRCYCLLICRGVPRLYLFIYDGLILSSGRLWFSALCSRIQSLYKSPRNLPWITLLSLLANTDSNLIFQMLEAVDLCTLSRQRDLAKLKGLCSSAAIPKPARKSSSSFCQDTVTSANTSSMKDTYVHVRYSKVKSSIFCSYLYILTTSLWYWACWPSFKHQGVHALVEFTNRDSVASLLREAAIPSSSHEATVPFKSRLLSLKHQGAADSSIQQSLQLSDSQSILPINHLIQMLSKKESVRALIDPRTKHSKKPTTRTVCQWLVILSSRLSSRWSLWPKPISWRRRIPVCASSSAPCSRTLQRHISQNATSCRLARRSTALGNWAVTWTWSWTWTASVEVQEKRWINGVEFGLIYDFYL